MRKFAIVLAAGQGTRMKSKLYKVLHPVCGKAMVDHVVTALEKSQVERIVTIVGHGADALKTALGNRTEYAVQQEQLGTGHAVMQAEQLLKDEPGTTIVICGDTPLLSEHSIQHMLELHEEQASAATIMTAIVDNPTGYGRIVRDGNNQVQGIVEQKDCSEAEQLIKEINTGTYCFDNLKLFTAISKLSNDNAQGEYYLTDIISILHRQGERIHGYRLPDADEAIGVNDRVALAEAERLMRERIARRHMQQGITLIDPNQTYIEPEVEIGADTVIYPGVRLTGKTKVGVDCILEAQTEIHDSLVGSGVHIRKSVIEQSEIGDQCKIGPFAYIRPGTKLGQRVKLGDFVEIKNSHIDSDSKVPHLSYVGDSEVGKHVNIGCGVITCNYNGIAKNRTVIADHAFIGSNVNLVAPVRIGQGAYVVAGSTITKDVEEDDMAIARQRQTNKEGYAVKLKRRFQQEKDHQ